MGKQVVCRHVTKRRDRERSCLSEPRCTLKKQHIYCADAMISTQVAYDTNARCRFLSLLTSDSSTFYVTFFFYQQFANNTLM